MFARTSMNRFVGVAFGFIAAVVLFRLPETLSAGDFVEIWLQLSLFGLFGIYGLAYFFELLDDASCGRRSASGLFTSTVIYLFLGQCFIAMSYQGDSLQWLDTLTFVADLGFHLVALLALRLGVKYWRKEKELDSIDHDVD
tara:strand:- start:308 stop:730 length:423 start_codon:yes stop_codon:yes gene_type:complete